MDIQKFFDLIKMVNDFILADKNYSFDEGENFDYNILKESLLTEINQTFDEIIAQLNKSIEEIESYAVESTEQGDTNSVNILLKALEQSKKALIDLAAHKQEIINELIKHFKIDHETTAFYSKPNYNGDEYLVSGNSKSSIVRFYPKSIRVAKGCSITVFPYEDYRAHRSYKAPTFNKSTPVNLPSNVSTGSMVSSPIQFRATSWKITST